MAIKKTLNKKGGCREYANISDDYNLLLDALKQKVGGSRSRQNKGGCSSYADVDSSYMISEAKKVGGSRSRQKKGGDMWNITRDMLNTGSTIFSSQPTQAAAPKAVAPQAAAPKAVAPQAVAPQAVAPKAVAPQAVAPKAVAPQAAVAHNPVAKGGNRRGGCGCSTTQRNRKGGAIQLAPFAAAVALLTARYVANNDILFDEDSRKKSSKSKTINCRRKNNN